jgi:tetratricopeptide (TPR) repeat protein
MARLFYCYIFVICLTAISGCALKYNSAVMEANDNMPTPQSKSLLAKAQLLYAQTNDMGSLKVSMDAYQAVLSRNPGDYEALVQLSNQYILLGTAYTQKRKDKSANFHKAMRFAELAMYNNPAFKDHIKDGKNPWEAAGELGKQETEAMFYWVTALQYEFKEGMTLAGKIRNVQWLKNAIIFLDQIEKVNPEFGGGAVEFAKGICYYVLPKSKGGSKKIGEDYLQKAVAKGKDRLLPRWGRAKYFYEVTGNDEKAFEDLSWVAAQDLKSFEDPYPWRVYFQKDAQALLLSRY